MIPEISIEQGVQALKAGQLVVIPTETVYGLAADAKNEEAIQSIFKVKNRPKDHPLILHLASLSELPNWAVNVPRIAYQLAEYFWPGPLTLVLQKHPQVSPIITGGQNTIAIRIPNHSATLALLQQFGGAIVAPSANLFTQLSPTSSELVQANFPHSPKEIAGIIEGGPCTVGIESTIVDCTQENGFKILRPGVISETEILNVLQQDTLINNNPQAAPRVSGSHQKHYAPNVPTFLVNAAFILEKCFPKEPIALITFTQKLDTNILPNNIKHYPLPVSAKACAHSLYQTLFNAQQQSELILIEACPFNTPEWLGVNDRITKATSGQYYGITATIKT